MINGRWSADENEQRLRLANNVGPYTCNIEQIATVDVAVGVSKLNPALENWYCWIGSSVKNLR